jgi:hypothetical protein
MVSFGTPLTISQQLCCDVEPFRVERLWSSDADCQCDAGAGQQVEEVVENPKKARLKNIHKIIHETRLCGVYSSKLQKVAETARMSGSACL